LLLAFFLLLFPKGGFKVGSIPITWGYTLLGSISLLLFFKSKIRVLPNHLAILSLLLPFQIVSIFNFALNQIGSFGYGISFFISFFILPLMFCFVLSKHMQNLDLALLLKIVQRGVFFLACYGIFLFFFKIFTGKFFAIPLLTTNLGDSFAMENKCISRGSMFKLISTFNNGNIFGICLLMILPLYQLKEKRLSRKFIVKLALLLTLSRTVWIGLIIHEFVDLLFLQKNKFFSCLKFLFFLLSFAGFSIFIIQRTDISLSFFLDVTLGNRIQQFEELFSSTLLGNTPFCGISEISYMGVLKNFGYLGLITFLIAMTGPLLLSKLSNTSSSQHLRIRWGLINYLIISLSDGAIMFIPTMAFFWFLSSLLNTKTSLDNNFRLSFSKNIP